MDFKEVKKIADKVDGWFYDREDKLLYNLAKQCKRDGVIVEIGSWKGKSTIYLGHGSKEGKNVKIYAVDPHPGNEAHQRGEEVGTLKDFKKNIKDANVDDIVVPIVKTSEDAAKDFIEPVQLIFIDGDHEYEGVKKDFELWFPKVKEGGIMAFHDTVARPGPKKVVFDSVYKSKHFKNIGLAGSVTYAQKVDNISKLDLIKNRWAFLNRRLYQYLNKTLPKPIKKFIKKIIT